MLKSTNKKYVSIILNAQGKILPYDLFLTIAKRYSGQVSSFCTCSVRSIVTPREKSLYRCSLSLRRSYKLISLNGVIR